VAVLGGAFACIAIVLISLGLFQPSSNARKFALAAYATLQYFNIRNRYRFPINGKDTPESMMEMPIPLLIALQRWWEPCLVGQTARELKLCGTRKKQHYTRNMP
jgi:hypothetical protein